MIWACAIVLTLVVIVVVLSDMARHSGTVPEQTAGPLHPAALTVACNGPAALQDGSTRKDMIAPEVNGEEKAPWWERAVEAFPDYAAYQQKTDREIPVFLLEPASS